MSKTITVNKLPFACDFFYRLYCDQELRIMGYVGLNKGHMEVSREGTNIQFGL